LIPDFGHHVLADGADIVIIYWIRIVAPNVINAMFHSLKRQKKTFFNTNYKDIR
jgi:hypothetical protein